MRVNLAMGKLSRSAAAIARTGTTLLSGLSGIDFAVGEF
jgi:hypothetical protein